MPEISVDRECWNCLHLEVEGETMETHKLVCLKKYDPYNKNQGRCPNYDWDEVGDEDPY